MSLLACVPNVSEGRRRVVIDALADAVRTSQATLADVSSDSDHHRTVLTLIGTPGSLVDAMESLAAVALETIDLRLHSGVHPRLGCLDVVPFVPLGGTDMEVAIQAAVSFGRWLGEGAGLPVFLYGEASRRSELRVPTSLRKLGLGGVAAAVEEGSWSPDFGPSRVDPACGLTLVGARSVLIAFNVLLDTDQVEIARRVARNVRESSGGLPGVQALGFFLDSRGLAQVSMNLLDPATTTLYDVVERVRREARACGVALLSSEIVGLVPRAAIDEMRIAELGLDSFGREKVVETYLDA